MNQDFRVSSRVRPEAAVDENFGWTVSDAFNRLLREMADVVMERSESRKEVVADEAQGMRRISMIDGVYVISVAARIVEMHPNTLRKYDREGLVSPSRSEGRQRLYSDTDVQRLQVVRTLSDKYNLNIDGVKLVLDLVHLMSDVAGLLDSSPDVAATRTARIAASELRRVLKELGAG